MIRLLKDGDLRNKFIATGLILTALTLSGCGNASVTASESHPQAISGPIATPEASLEASKLPEYIHAYPELKTIPLKNEFTVRVDETKATVFNFIERQINKNSIKSAIEYFEEMSKSNRVENWTDNQRNRDLSISLNKRLRNEIVFFVIPSDFEGPKWPGISRTAATTGAYLNEPYYSFVRDLGDNETFVSKLATTREEELQKRFLTEICQSNISVIVNDKDADLAQEIICNSYPFAFIAKAQEKSYEEYYKIASEIQIGPNPQIKYNLYVLIFDEWQGLPVIKNIFYK